jgi:hypothetical protein
MGRICSMHMSMFCPYVLIVRFGMMKLFGSLRNGRENNIKMGHTAYGGVRGFFWLRTRFGGVLVLCVLVKFII